MEVGGESENGKQVVVEGRSERAGGEVDDTSRGPAAFLLAQVP